MVFDLRCALPFLLCCIFSTSLWTLGNLIQLLIFTTQRIFRELLDLHFLSLEHSLGELSLVWLVIITVFVYRLYVFQVSIGTVKILVHKVPD